MKKISLLLASAGICIATLQSCKKQEQSAEQPPVTQTVDATVKVNETYSYTLPATDGPEPYVVVKQAEHPATIKIEKNSAGNFVFNYTPTENFAGTDVIVLADGKEGHGACEHPECDHREHHQKLFHKGNCGHGGKQKHIVTINLTINNVTTAVASTATNK